MPFNLASIGASIWGFAKKIPDWVIWALAALVLLKFIDMNAERRGRASEKDKSKARDAKREAEVINTITENSNELVRESERVRARDARVELPDGTEGLPSYHYRD